MLRSTLWIVILMLMPPAAFTQTPVDPAAHMRYLSALEEQLSRKYLSYISEVAHGGKAARMEKRREEVVASVKGAMRDAARLRPWQGDASLRDAYRAYWSVLLSVFTEDYHQVVDMEAVAERSYHEMEAYLLIQEKAAEKLRVEFQRLGRIYENFAVQHNVTLVEEDENKLARKLEQAGRVNKYTNQLFLVTFKSALQETIFIEAYNTQDVSALEQARASMLRFAQEGLAVLDTVKSFDGDESLIFASRKLLEFYKGEASAFVIYVDLLRSTGLLDEIRAKTEAEKSPGTRTEIDAYNAAANEHNEKVERFNAFNKAINAEREQARNDYEAVRKAFLSRHIPHA